MPKNTPKKKTNIDDNVRKLYVDKKSRKDTPVSTVAKLANPITIMAHKIQSLLEYDYRVLTDFDFAEQTLYVYISDKDKISAYSRYLKRKHEFGNLILNIKLFSISDGECEEINPPTYEVTVEERVKLFMELFPETIMPDFTSLVDQLGKRWDFFEFPLIGLSYQADSLENIHGFMHELLYKIVMEVFDTTGFQIS